VLTASDTAQAAIDQRLAAALEGNAPDSPAD
jgi:hypothetical protein